MDINGSRERNYRNRAAYYNLFRKADHRLTDAIIQLLKCDTGSVILDIGAGTGNYSSQFADRGFKVVSIEPELEMSSRSADDRIQWLTGMASTIEMKDDSADGAVIINAIHHIPDVEDAFREIQRVVTAGTVVIVTFDPIVACESHWLFDYWPHLTDYERKHYMPLEVISDKLEKITAGKVRIFPYDIPCDFEDCFTAAIWRRPALMLNERYRESVSILSSLDEVSYEKGRDALMRDLRSGAWREKYGELLMKNTLDVGCRLVSLVF